MRVAAYISILLVITSMGCKNFDNAPTAALSSFIHIYENASDLEGQMAVEDSDGGYIIAGNLIVDANHSDIILIKTDNVGNELWESTIPNGIVSSILSTDDGYLVAGDSIQYNPQSTNISEIDNTFARLVKMDKSGHVVNQFIRSDSIVSLHLHVDYHGSAVNVADNGDIYFLGSFKGPVSPDYEQTFVSVLDGNLQTKWTQSYQLQDRDYNNCHTISIDQNGDLIWGATSYKSSQNVASAYLTIIHIAPNSTFKDWALFGENDGRNHFASDLEPTGIGFAVVGTYAENNGQNGNIYFVRVSQNGDIVDGTERYFDGVDITLQDRDQSKSEDSGDAVTATYDGGYVIGGHMQSTPNKGNGGTDILLIKIDAFGNHVWDRLIGGTGDESVSSIRETSDHGILICGTNVISGLSTIVLIKTDQNGQFRN